VVFAHSQKINNNVPNGAPYMAVAVISDCTVVTGSGLPLGWFYFTNQVRFDVFTPFQLIVAPYFRAESRTAHIRLT
jgi:hypothetical protein